ncbi:hypothetical protein N8202_05980 [Gammaproteobacteria bacterium]|jgi:hypothetical protein|nr:hypothetical protein [Gammaproteobacteria bacterium]
MFKFSFEPKKVSEKYYENARNEIIQYYSQNIDVISIYEYGSVSSPGVSDLDIILVLKDDVKTKEDFFDFSNISEEVHNLVADGNVMKMSQENFININFLDNKINVKKLYGKDLSRKLPEKFDQEILDLISVIDWLPERILRLTRAVTNKNINITMVLCILHSFSYSIKRIDDLADIDIESSKSQVTLKKIRLLRNDWYTLDNPQETLIDCIQESISLGYTYLDIFESFLKSNNSYCKSNIILDEDSNLELYKNHFIRFVNSKNSLEKENLARNTSTDDKTFVFISSYFYPHFVCLASQSGMLSSVMNKKISQNKKSIERELLPNYKMNLIRKMAMAESNAQFLIKNNMKNGLIRYGFHFKN